MNFMVNRLICGCSNFKLTAMNVWAEIEAEGGNNNNNKKLISLILTLISHDKI